MPEPMTAAALLGVAVTGVTTVMGMSSAEKASNAQVRAAREAAALEREASREALAFEKEKYTQGRADIEPWREAGVQAIEQLKQLGELEPGKFEESPGYQFRLKEGNRMMNRAFAQRGQGVSGERMKAGQKYGQGLASQEYQGWLDRFYQRLGSKAGLYGSMAGYGGGAAANMANLGARSAGNVANILMTSSGRQGQYGLRVGDARASSYVNRANILSQGTTSMFNNLSTMAMMYGGGGKGGGRRNIRPQRFGAGF